MLPSLPWAITLPHPSSRPASRKDDTVLHSLLEAEVDALRSKVVDLETNLASSQASCSQLQQDLRGSKQQHSTAIGRFREEAERLTSQVPLPHQPCYCVMVFGFLFRFGL